MVTSFNSLKTMTRACWFFFFFFFRMPVWWPTLSLTLKTHMYAGFFFLRLVSNFNTLKTPTLTKVMTYCMLDAFWVFGKIQGDGRKFLDRFKSYFGSQISSQSLNEIHIYPLQPKSATKGYFFHIFLSLILSSSRRMLPFDVWPSFPVTTWTLP